MIPLKIVLKLKLSLGGLLTSASSVQLWAKKHQFKTLNIIYKRKLYKAQNTHTHVGYSCLVGASN